MARLVPLTVCYSIPEAHILVSALGSHGVYASIAAIHHGTLAWTHLVALGGLEVRVFDAQLSDAQAMLMSVDPQDEILTESEAYRQRPWFYAAIFCLFLYLGAYYPLWLRHRRKKERRV